LPTTAHEDVFLISVGGENKLISDAFSVPPLSAMSFIRDY